MNEKKNPLLALCESSPEFIEGFKEGIAYADRTPPKPPGGLSYDRRDPEQPVEGISDSEEVMRLSDVVLMRNVEVMHLNLDIEGLRLAILEALKYFERSSDTNTIVGARFLAEAITKTPVARRRKPDDIMARLHHFQQLCERDSRVPLAKLQGAWARVMEALDLSEERQGVVSFFHMPTLEEAETELRAMGLDPEEVGRRGAAFVAKLKAKREASVADGVAYQSRAWHQTRIMGLYRETFQKLADAGAPLNPEPHVHAEGTCTYGEGYNDGFREGLSSQPVPVCDRCHLPLRECKCAPPGVIG